jgi:hypothetical protein
MNANKRPKSLFEGINLAKMTSTMMKFFEILIWKPSDAHLMLIKYF